MTVASSVSKSGPYTGNGATTVFAFGFKVQQAADIKVVRTVTTSGVQTDTTLTSGTDYTVAVNADQSASPGGSITTMAAPTASQQITILRNVTATQGTSIPNQGGFYPKVVENALDKLTMLAQQLYEEVGRAIKVSASGVGGSAADFLVQIQTGVTTTENNAVAAADSASFAAQQAQLATTNGAAQVALAAQQAQLATTNGAAQVALAETAATNAHNSEVAAAQSAASAAASAGGIPTIGASDAGKAIVVNQTHDGFVLGVAGAVICADSAALTAITAIDKQTAIVIDSGLFRFDASSTEAADAETCFAPNVGGGRWLLELPSWDLLDAMLFPDASEQDDRIEDTETRLTGAEARLTTNETAWPGRILRAIVACSITSVAATSAASFTATVATAAIGDAVIATPPDALGPRLAVVANVTAANTVTVTINNPSTASQTIATGNWKITVIKES